ncbi:MAG: ATP-binding protein [Verrucomicrobia bacterium]|nr:ATP-binding protein [Verrucomicrobiota bacterium]
MSSSASELRAPLPSWANELARLWNGGAHSLFLLHGNIFDLFPVRLGPPPEYAALNTFLARRLFPDRGCLMFFDIGEGLTFATPAMQTRFFEWLRIYDEVEHTDFHQQGPPRTFGQLAPLLRRFFLHAADEKNARDRGITLVLNFPEKLVPATEESGASVDERMALVTLLKWAAAPDLQLGDVGIVLVTETAAELHADLIQHPQIASVRIPLPDLAQRRQFLDSGWIDRQTRGPRLTDSGNLPADDLARRTSGLSLLRVEQLGVTALRAGEKLTVELVSAGKRRLIEEYCQGLVRFKDPRPGVSLDHVATHAAAKARLRELAWLIRQQKDDVLERGVLVPGRVGVGKSFLIDCFASECGLPVLEIGEFRSKWVGETERQQARILLTIRALGPVIVVVDEADAVFGNRAADGDSGVSSRVFAAFAAHLGDSSLRGRELWIAMTSRPDLMAIDLKRQGRFGLCVPLFPAQNADEVAELFTVIARVKKIALNDDILAYVRAELGARPLTGSDVEAILVRAKERAVLASRDSDVQLADLREAVDSFIDPLDPDLLALQELAAVLACSDRRFLPEKYRSTPRADLSAAYAHARRTVRA